MKKILVSIMCLWAFANASFAQVDSNPSLDIDDIEVIVKGINVAPKGDSVTLELLLHSYLKDPRELTINTFASGLINPQGKVMFYESMMMGKVKVVFADRQNYLHYFLKRNEPVLYTIKTVNWKKVWGKPQQFRMTLEDHAEPGKFLQVDIPL